MATIVSTTSGNTTTYTITDQAGNTGTVTAPSSGAPRTAATIGFSITGLLADGIQLLNTLVEMLNSGLRPNVMPGTVASFQS